MNNLYSIIMPTYNAEKYIKYSIDSVRNQVYKNWELVVIDDNSKDNTVDIVKSYINKDQRIKLFKNQGKGAGSARNTGIEKAQGNYIAFIDSDDIYDPLFLKEANKQISKFNADCVVFDYFRFSGSNLDNGVLKRVGISPYNSFTACWNKVYKRELWDNSKFITNMKIEDLQIIPIVVGKAKKVVHAPKDVMYYYRNNINSVTRTESINDALKIEIAIDQLIDNMKKNHMVFDSNAETFINDLIFPHLVRGIENSDSRKNNRILYKSIAKYLKDINTKYFKQRVTIYNSNSLKKIRTSIIMILFKLGLYGLGFRFMKLSWYIGGKLHK